MAQGLLEVTGAIDLSQFWPAGTADADTTKIKVEVGPGAFRFRPHPGSAFAVTHAFDNAKVIGSNGATEPVKNGNLTVRLQGIDAPELHYRPSAHKKKADQTAEQHQLYLKWNLDYRQHLAETTTMALAAFLGTLGADPLPCKVRTAVDSPEEVFDTYGRFVGNITVQTPGGELDVNLWLAEQGLAFPAFYASMSSDEIHELTVMADAAYFAGRGIWPYLSDAVGTTAFDTDLEFRGKNAVPNPAADVGPVMIPKLFRRLSAFVVNRKAKMVSGTFEKYLKSKRSSDSVFLTPDFILQGASAATVRYLDEFVTSDMTTVWPEELVFREKPSRIIGPGGAAVHF